MATGKVRIIGGRWRSRLISFPQLPDLRPTADRIRETLFNWLGQDLTGLSCLDLFSGSGALGFEAASRGADQVVMLENDDKAYQALKYNKHYLQAEQIEVIRDDALHFLQRDARRFDVIFVDPPYRLELLSRILSLLSLHLEENGLVYLESNKQQVLGSEWRINRQSKAGSVFYQLVELQG